MHTVLVTGGTGFIGSHTCISLIENGYDIVIVDNLVNSKKEACNRIEKITGKKVKFYEIDCCDKDALSKVFEENKIDSVIHFAGLKAVGESVKMPLEYYKNNINSALTVVELMKKYDVKNIIFSSSGEVNSRCYSDIAHSVPMLEAMLVGVAAERVEADALAWDHAAQRFDNAAANALIRPYIRPGWEF